MFGDLFARTIGRLACWLMGSHELDWHRVDALGLSRRCEKCRRVME